MKVSLIGVGCCRSIEIRPCDMARKGELVSAASTAFINRRNELRGPVNSNDFENRSLST